MQLRHAQSGFTLTELAVVMMIIGLLIGGGIMTLTAQIEQRNHDETQRRLNGAVDALLAYSIVNRRLPCPAVGATTGDEAPAGGVNCTTWYGGFLPARTIGFQPTNDDGYAVDSWGNAIRYAVARDVTGCTTAPPAGTRIFTSQANLKTYGVSCRPNDLDVCTSAACASRVVSTQTAVLVVYSTGPNGASTASNGPDEVENKDADAIFVSRAPTNSASSAGTYDDLVVFAPVGVFYTRLIAAGVLP